MTRRRRKPTARRLQVEEQIALPPEFRDNPRLFVAALDFLAELVQSMEAARTGSSDLRERARPGRGAPGRRRKRPDPDEEEDDEDE